MSETKVCYAQLSLGHQIHLEATVKDFFDTHRFPGVLTSYRVKRYLEANKDSQLVRSLIAVIGINVLSGLLVRLIIYLVKRRWNHKTAIPEDAYEV